MLVMSFAKGSIRRVSLPGSLIQNTAEEVEEGKEKNYRYFKWI